MTAKPEQETLKEWFEGECKNHVPFNTALFLVEVLMPALSRKIAEARRTAAAKAIEEVQAVALGRSATVVRYCRQRIAELEKQLGEAS